MKSATVSFKPYDIATIQLPTSKRRRVVECISRPFPANDDGTGEMRIKVRMVPTDPETMTECAVSELWYYGKCRWVQVAEVSVQEIHLPSLTQPIRMAFPEDMLRYDSCALYDHTQHEEVPSERFPGDTEPFRPNGPVRIYRLTRIKDHPWTVGRWNSFGATITPLATFDLRKQV